MIVLVLTWFCIGYTLWDIGGKLEKLIEENW
jgi:hypothetical protein